MPPSSSLVELGVVITTNSCAISFDQFTITTTIHFRWKIPIFHGLITENWELSWWHLCCPWRHWVVFFVLFLTNSGSGSDDKVNWQASWQLSILRLKKRIWLFDGLTGESEHWKTIVVMIPTSLSLTVMQIVVMTNCGVASDNKVDIILTLCFRVIIMPTLSFTAPVH